VNNKSSTRCIIHTQTTVKIRRKVGRRGGRYAVITKVVVVVVAYPWVRGGGWRGAIRGCPRETTARVAQCTNFRSPTITPTIANSEGVRERERKNRALSGEEFAGTRGSTESRFMSSGSMTDGDNREKGARKIKFDRDSAIKGEKDESLASCRVAGDALPPRTSIAKWRAASRKENAYALLANRPFSQLGLACRELPRLAIGFSRVWRCARAPACDALARERVAYVPLGKSRTRSGRELGIRAIRFLKHSDGSGRSPESRLSLARVPLLPLPHSTPWKLNRAKGT
jgi:hypothetical protein